MSGVSQRLRHLTSTQTSTHTHSLASLRDNGVMVYMSYLSKTELQVFKKLLMKKKLLPHSLGITWQQLNRANWAETVHLLVESLPGDLAWNVAHEILQKMNQRRICSLLLKELKDILPTLEPKDFHLRKPPLSLTKEECGKIRGVQTARDGKEPPCVGQHRLVWKHINVRNHEAILPCLFLPRSPQGRQPKIVVIHGIPGIGKIMLARKMRLMWAHNEFNVHKLKYAFCFHCRELNWVGECSFSELIEGQELVSCILYLRLLYLRFYPDQINFCSCWMTLRSSHFPSSQYQLTWWKTGIRSCLGLFS